MVIEDSESAVADTNGISGWKNRELDLSYDSQLISFAMLVKGNAVDLSVLMINTQGDGLASIVLDEWIGFMWECISRFLMIIALLAMTCSCLPMETTATASADEISVAFWNVENLFDQYDDPMLDAEDILSRSEVQKKLANDARVIEYLDADIVGLMEVENHQILRELVSRHLAKKGYYYFVVLEGKDTRGIDVGVIAKRPFLVRSFAIPGFPRGIMAARFTNEGEPFYVVINHWKSRRNGGEESRIKAAQTLAQIVTREIRNYEGKNVPVICGGDFNDNDEDRSLKILEDEAGLINPLKSLDPEKRWTLGHFDSDRGEMELVSFDHLLINQPAFKSSTMRFQSAEVVRPSFMLNRRTINGKRYELPLDDYKDRIGFSDHFPVKGRFVLGD